MTKDRYVNYHIPEGALVLLTMDSGMELLVQYEGSRRCRPKFRAERQSEFTNTHKIVHLERIRSFRMFSYARTLLRALVSADSDRVLDDALGSDFVSPLLRGLWFVAGAAESSSVLDAWILSRANRYNQDDYPQLDF